MIAGMKVHDELYKRFVGEKSQVSVDYSGSLSVLSRSVAALVTSGTATLETALMGIPQIVCYKTNKLSYQIAKKLIKVPYISLVNLILRSRAVPEMIQDNCTVDFLSEGLMKILPGGENRHDQLGITDLLRKEIGNVSVSDKLALLIINSLSAS